MKGAVHLGVTVVLCYAAMGGWGFVAQLIAVVLMGFVLLGTYEEGK